VPAPASVPGYVAGPEGRGGRARPANDRPGDDFGARTDWHALLEPHGWCLVCERVGWVEAGAVFLDPGADYNAAEAQARRGNGTLGVGEATLRKRLHEAGALAGVERDGEKTYLAVRRIVQGRRQRVLHVRRTWVLGEQVGQVGQLFPIGTTVSVGDTASVPGATGPNGHAPPTTPTATIGTDIPTAARASRPVPMNQPDSPADPATPTAAAAPTEPPRLPGCAGSCEEPGCPHPGIPAGDLGDGRLRCAEHHLAWRRSRSTVAPPPAVSRGQGAPPAAGPPGVPASDGGAAAAAAGEPQEVWIL